MSRRMTKRAQYTYLVILSLAILAFHILPISADLTARTSVATSFSRNVLNSTESHYFSSFTVDTTVDLAFLAETSQITSIPPETYRVSLRFNEDIDTVAISAVCGLIYLLDNVTGERSPLSISNPNMDNFEDIYSLLNVPEPLKKGGHHSLQCGVRNTTASDENVITFSLNSTDPQPIPLQSTIHFELMAVTTMKCDDDTQIFPKDTTLTVTQYIRQPKSTKFFPQDLPLQDDDIIATVTNTVPLIGISQYFNTETVGTINTAWETAIPTRIEKGNTTRLLSIDMTSFRMPRDFTYQDNSTFENPRSSQLSRCNQNVRPDIYTPFNTTGFPYFPIEIDYIWLSNSISHIEPLDPTLLGVNNTIFECIVNQDQKHDVALIYYENSPEDLNLPSTMLDFTVGKGLITNEFVSIQCPQLQFVLTTPNKSNTTDFYIDNSSFGFSGLINVVGRLITEKKSTFRTIEKNIELPWLPYYKHAEDADFIMLTSLSWYLPISEQTYPIATTPLPLISIAQTPLASEDFTQTKLSSTTAHFSVLLDPRNNQLSTRDNIYCHNHSFEPYNITSDSSSTHYWPSLDVTTTAVYNNGTQSVIYSSQKTSNSPHFFFNSVAELGTIFGLSQAQLAQKDVKYIFDMSYSFDNSTKHNNSSSVSIYLKQSVYSTILSCMFQNKSTLAIVASTALDTPIRNPIGSVISIQQPNPMTVYSKHAWSLGQQLNITLNNIHEDINVITLAFNDNLHCFTHSSQIKEPCHRSMNISSTQIVQKSVEDHLDYQCVLVKNSTNATPIPLTVTQVARPVAEWPITIDPLTPVPKTSDKSDAFEKIFYQFRIAPNVINTEEAMLVESNSYNIQCSHLYIKADSKKLFFSTSPMSIFGDDDLSDAKTNVQTVFYNSDRFEYDYSQDDQGDDDDDDDDDSDDSNFVIYVVFGLVFVAVAVIISFFLYRRYQTSKEAEMRRAQINTGYGYNYNQIN